MLVGAMNHPLHDLFSEIATFKRLGFDFIDLALEPLTEPQRLDAQEVKGALERHTLSAVGHTFWALPIASAVEPLREAALRVIEIDLDFFANVGITAVTVHPDDRVPMFGPDWILECNASSLKRLVAYARQYGITLMAENTPGMFSRPAILQSLLKAVAGLTLHLDIGHANLRTLRNTSNQILALLGSSLRHVHLSDNRGGEDDLHLPLGAGRSKWRQAIKWLKRANYDGTISLEVFTPDIEYLVLSQQKLRQWWAEGAR
jgi:sugar phosphate isomerase/epimerase